MVAVVVLAVSHKLALQALVVAEYNTLRAWRDMKVERVVERLRSRQKLRVFSGRSDVLASFLGD